MPLGQGWAGLGTAALRLRRAECRHWEPALQLAPSLQTWPYCMRVIPACTSWRDARREALVWAKRARGAMWGRGRLPRPGVWQSRWTELGGGPAWSLWTSLHCRHWGDSPPIVTCAVSKQELKLLLTECGGAPRPRAPRHSQDLYGWSGRQCEQHSSQMDSIDSTMNSQTYWSGNKFTLYEDGLDRRVENWALGHTAEFRSSWLCGFLEATLVSNLSTSSKEGFHWPETQWALHAEPLESAPEMHVVTEASGGQKTPSCSSGQRRRSKYWGHRIERPFPAGEQGPCAEVSRRDRGWEHTHGAGQEERFRAAEGTRVWGWQPPKTSAGNSNRLSLWGQLT